MNPALRMSNLLVPRDILVGQGIGTWVSKNIDFSDSLTKIIHASGKFNVQKVKKKSSEM